MILGLTGLAQSGKDTCASYLIDNYGFTRRAFADKLKDFCYLINPELKEAVDAVGWESAKRIPVYRRFLQDVGHNARVVFGTDFWVDQVLSQDEYGLYANAMDDAIVLTDMRYANEFQRVESFGGTTVRIERPGLAMINNHVTETQHLHIPVDFTVVNDGLLADLYDKLDEIMEELDVAHD